MKKLVSVLFLLATTVHGQVVWAPPADRVVPWQPGVPGGIPHRTSICANLAAGATSAQVQSALDACPAEGVVLLGAGVFNFTSTVFVPSDRTLRGSGVSVTRIRGGTSVQFQTAPVTIGHLWPGWVASRNLASNAPRGATTAALVNVTGLTVGQHVLIDQITDPAISTWGSGCTGVNAECRGWFTRQNRPIGEMLKITAISGNTISFEPALSIDYKTTSTAQVTRFADNGGTAVPLVSRAGVEDVTIENLAWNNEKGGVLLVWAAESWARNVEVYNTKGDNVSLDGCFRCTVRDSRFQIPAGTSVSTGGGWYGLSFAHYSSHNLIENSIFDGHNKVMVMRAAGPGNVIAYNVFDNGWISGQDWTETGLNPAHMATPHHTLFEGNWAFNGGGENTWGNGIYSTYFRNHLTGKRTRFDYQNFTRAGSPMEGHWWDTWAGNVMGLPVQPSFVYEQFGPQWGGHAIWKIGVNPETWVVGDSKVISTLIREANYDYQRLQNDGSATALPNSLYLSVKPGFFGEAPWPWVEPLGPVKTHCLPARARLDNTSCSSGGGPTPTPTPTIVAPTATPVSPTATPTPTVVPPTPTPTPIIVVPTATPTPVPSGCQVGLQEVVAWPLNAVDRNNLLAQRFLAGWRWDGPAQSNYGFVVFTRTSCPN